MRRAKYLGQIFDCKFFVVTLGSRTDSTKGKMNELGMVLRVDEDDDRSPFVAGMEDVDIEEVIRVRECTLTNKPYPFMSFRADGRAAYPPSMSKEEMKRQIFQGGRLTCRVVNILFISGKNGKPYSGIVRHLYAQESDALETQDDTPEVGLSLETSISVEDDEEDECVIVSKETSARKRRARSDSLEMFDAEPPKRRSSHPMKKQRFIFGDVFCGCGGASQGAVQAGYYVAWGLDNDLRALQSYHLNHPSAHAFQKNAHDFPPSGVRKEDLRVDVLHLSPPCCFWSPAQ
jgi:DNA (cytosine-5)-methyltransferase 1